MNTFQVTNSQGTTFNVEFKADQKDLTKSTVSFYDSRYPHTPLGQHTGATYYVLDLIKHLDKDFTVFQLWTDIPAWHIEAEPFKALLEELREEYDEWVQAANEDAQERRLS